MFCEGAAFYNEGQELAATKDKNKPVPMLTGIHHISVPASDPLASSDWYARVLGFATLLIEERENDVVGRCWSIRAVSDCYCSAPRRRLSHVVNTHYSAWLSQLMLNCCAGSNTSPRSESITALCTRCILGGR